MEWVSIAADDIWTRILQFVVWGNARSPELMIGLAIMLALPPLAIFGLVLYRQPSRPYMPRAPRDDGYVADWRQHFSIAIEGSDRPPAEIALGLTRIGRQEDNEICIADASVHRYHAAIERSPEMGVLICDLSGPEGNGIRINGERVEMARLSDGDLVEVGKAKLRLSCQTEVERYEQTTMA